MGVRSRLASGFTSLAKVFGNVEPAAMRQGEIASQMTPATPFSPGEPIGPYDGFSRNPRTREFVPGYNISARPRSHERVSFDTLRGLVEAYDVAQMAIWHRIDSIRALDWSLISAEGYGDDVTDIIPTGMRALKKPDRDTPFEGWLAQYLYDVLAYDAGTLYRMRNRAGRAIGLRVIDGTGVAPLLDYWGNTPQDPAEAYVQYVQGLPWNWLTRSDLIYSPFRKRTNTPYGLAPLETILLNANTDLRFQAYFLQRFTEGNIPEAFASAPETWTPQQIEAFQGYWDAFMLGDQSTKHQIKWIPGGSTMAWSNEKDFSDHFSLFLMRKTAAAFHVVPADLGFTENVNRSSGESQADVQHRVGDLPLIKHVQGVLTSFLQDDLGLPLRFAFDLGEEQADRKDQAEADKIYVEMGAIGPSDVREMRYGLPEPDGQPVPRFIFTSRAGPIPLASLKAVSGQVDPATAAPVPGTELPHTVFGGAEGVAPVPPIKDIPLAEQMYGPSAMPPAPPPQPIAQFDVNGQMVKDAVPAVTEGVTSETGITSYDLVGHNPAGDDDEARQIMSHRYITEGEARQAAREAAVKAEMRAFRSFKGQRRRRGSWHDFEFRHVDRVQAHRLNDAGRFTVRKAAGEIAVAGLAVRAADTGRVLMLQRALDDSDPASGTWEMPGGHCEGDETPLHAAWREWAEETGCIPPPGEQTGTWTSPNGVYQGIVWTVSSEACVPLNGDRDQISNPDDPDGDLVEAIAWWDPAQLPGNPAVRQELLDSIDAVMAALGQPQDGDEAVCPCGTPVVYDDIDGWQHADGSISHDDGESVSDKMRLAKAAKPGPKGRGGDSVKDGWPAWHVDQDLSAAYSARIRQALGDVLTRQTARRIASGWLNAQAHGQFAAAWLEETEPALAAQISDALHTVLTPLWTAAWAVGTTSAIAVMQGKKRVNWSKYSSGVTKAQGDNLSPIVDPSLMVYDQQSLQDWLDHYGIDSISSISSTRMDDLASLLETALEEGASPDSLVSDIEALGADESMTDMIASTEIARATSQASLASYEAAGVGQVSWLTAPGACTLCQDNESASPIPLGSPFPSGGDAPPGHPRCRCSCVPSSVGGADLPSIADLQDILDGFD